MTKILLKTLQIFWSVFILKKTIKTHKMKKNTIFFVLLSALSYSQVKTVSLNPLFINNGVFTTTSKDEDDGTWTKITSDNKILFMYPDDIENQENILTRRLANGSIDTSFGNSGYIHTKNLFTNNNDPSVLLDKNGNIFLASKQYSADFSSHNSKIVKFNPNGILDTTFGNNGEVTLNNIDIQSVVYNNTAELGNDNLIFVINNNLPNISSNSIICISPAGNIVTSFGNNGILTFDKSLNNLITYNNSIYTVSEKYSTDYSNWTYFIEKFDNNGVKDNNFATISETLIDGSTFLKIDSAGNLTTITNNVTITELYNSFVKKYNIATGSPIASFGNNATLSFDEIALVDVVFDTENNMILAGGKHLGDDVFNPYLTKFSSDGTLVTDFNQTGFYEELTNDLGYIDNIKMLNDEIIVSGIGDDYHKVFLANYLLKENLSVTENTKKNISVYPNPAKETLNIKSDDKILEAKIYNMQGQLLDNKQGSANKLNIQNLAKGIYLLKVSTENTKKTIQFIKE